MSLERINDIEVKPLPTKKDNRPVLGSKLFPKAYCAIYELGKKESGKTTVNFNIMVNCVGPNTTIVAFVPTFYNDENYLYMREYFKEKGVDFVIHTAIKENGRNYLEELVSQLKSEAMERDAEKQRQRHKKQRWGRREMNILDVEEEEREKRSKYQYPSYFILFDDISDQLRSEAFVTLVKNHRHYLSKVLVASQHFNDVPLGARKQIDYWLIFKGLDEDKLHDLYSESTLTVNFENFITMYHEATRDADETHDFFYVNSNRPDFRKNFNKQFILRRRNNLED